MECTFCKNKWDIKNHIKFRLTAFDHLSFLMCEECKDKIVNKTHCIYYCLHCEGAWLVRRATGRPDVVKIKRCLTCRLVSENFRR